jgi:hypothetical protein
VTQLSFESVVGLRLGGLREVEYVLVLMVITCPVFRQTIAVIVDSVKEESLKISVKILTMEMSLSCAKHSWVFSLPHTHILCHFTRPSRKNVTSSV